MGPVKENREGGKNKQFPKGKKRGMNLEIKTYEKALHVGWKQ